MATAASRIIEQYQAQGYVLPEHLTIEDVERAQRNWDINPIYVPLVANGIVTAWGVPFIDGQPLKHP